MTMAERSKESIQLEVGCLKDIVNALSESHFPSSRWSPLGLQLGLLQPTLIDIKAKYNNDPDECLQDCLTRWLSRADNVDENGGPTVKTLASALNMIGEVSTATKIAKLLNELSTSAYQVLRKHFHKHFPVSLPTDVSLTLHTEGVISKETFDEVEKSGGLLADSSLRALSSAVSEDPNRLRVFTNVLLQSEETVRVAKDILKEYDQMFPKVNLELSFQKKFDEMKVTFGKLIHTVAPLVAKGIPSLQELKTFLRRCYRELKPQLSIAESFDDVIELVEDKCTIINVVCLEAIVDTFNISEAKQHIKEYQAAIDAFCNEVKLSVCENQTFLTGLSTLLKCETVEFVLEWEPDDYTLIQIRDLLTVAFKDITKRVQIRVIKRGNSVIVTCYAPRHIMDVLLMRAEKNLSLLKKMGLIKLTIGYSIVWDERTKDKEMRELEEKTRKALDEVMELRSCLEAHTSKDENQSAADILSEKLKILDKMSKEKTLELESVRQLLQQREREIQELKSAHTKIEEPSIMERSVEPSIKDLLDKENEIEILQEKRTLQTLQVCERDEKISQVESKVKDNIKIQSKMSKARIFVMEQFKSAFKRKKVPSSLDNDDPLSSSVKHLSAYSDVQTEDHTLSSTGYNYVSRHDNQSLSEYPSESGLSHHYALCSHLSQDDHIPLHVHDDSQPCSCSCHMQSSESTHSQSTDPAHYSGKSYTHLNQDVPRYGYPDHNPPSHFHHHHQSSLTVPSTLSIPNEIPAISVQTPTPVMENVPISPTGTEPINSVPNTPLEEPDHQAMTRSRPQNLHIPEKPAGGNYTGSPVSDNVLLTVMLFLQHNCSKPRTCGTCKVIKRQFEKIVERNGQEAVQEAIKNIETSGTEGHKQLRRRDKHPTPVCSPMRNLGVKFERQRTHSTSHLHDEELTFSSTESEDDERTHRRKRQTRTAVNDDEYSIKDDAFQSLPLSAIGKEVSLSEPDLSPTPGIPLPTVFFNQNAFQSFAMPTKQETINSDDSGSMDDNNTSLRPGSNPQLDSEESIIPSAVKTHLNKSVPAHLQKYESSLSGVYSPINNYQRLAPDNTSIRSSPGDHHWPTYRRKGSSDLSTSAGSNYSAHSESYLYFQNSPPRNCSPQNGSNKHRTPSPINILLLSEASSATPL